MAIWLNSSEVSTLLDCTIRTVQNRIASGLYKSKTVSHAGYSGKKILIDLESLPLEAQEKYYGLQEQKRQDEILSLTRSQREKADFKLQVADFYRQAKAEGMTSEEFLTDYNAKYDCSVTRSQLFRWQNQYKTDGFIGLVDNRGTHNKGTSAIPEEAWDYFYSLYMTQQQRSIKLCYDLTKKVYPDIPTVQTFRNRADKIPHDALVYYREGEKAFNDKCLPYMSRTREGLKSNDIWCSDHHLCDFWVRHPAKKNCIARPWLTAFTDIKSGKLISYILRVEKPNAYVVKKCFRQGVEVFGLPETVYFDNGKDYKEKSFSRDYPLSLVNQLGIEVIYTQPYHGQSKPIERFFGTLEERCGKLFPTYTGRNAKKRPEEMLVANSAIYKKAPALEEAQKILDSFITEFHDTPSEACEMNGQTPNEVYLEHLEVKKVLRHPEILRILCGTFEERVVDRGYIRFKNRAYYHDSLVPMNRETVIVNYDCDNLDKLNIFNQDLTLVCVAEPNVKSVFGDITGEEYREAARRKKQAKAAIEAWKPYRKNDIFSIASEIQLEKKLANEPEPEKEVLQIVPEMDKNIDALWESGEPQRKDNSLVLDFLKRNA